MAVNEFGDTIVTDQPTVNEFGDPITINALIKSLKAAAPIVSNEDRSVNDFIAQARQNPVQKAAGGVGELLNTLVGQPVKAAVRLPVEIASNLATPNPNVPVPGLGGVLNNTQSIVEGLNRLALKTGNGLSEVIGNEVRSAKQSPVETALRAAFPALSQIYDLRSHTPSPQEIQNFKEDQAVNSVRNSGNSLIAPEVFGKTNPQMAQDVETVAPLIPVAGDVASGIASVAKKAISPIQTAKVIAESVAPKVMARAAEATPTQSAMAALDLSKEEAMTHVPVVVRQVSKFFGDKVPQTADEALSLLNQTESKLYGERLQTNNAAEKAGYVVNGDEALGAARDTLNKIPTITDDQRASILDDLSKVFEGNHTPDQGQALQQRLNKEFSAQYENGTFDKAAPLNEAKLAIRNSIADQMDDITKAVTGKDETPYSDIGSLIQVKEGLADKLRRLESNEANLKTGLQKSQNRIPVTSYQVKKQIKKGILSPLQKTQVERLDQAVQNIFTPPEAPPVLPGANEISPEALNAIRNKRLGAVGDQTPDIESQIQSIIQGYPRSLRSDPALARLAAESQLGIR